MPSASGIALKLGAIKPSRLVEIAYEPFTAQFTEKDISVEFHIPYSLPELSCDVAKIAWTLTILLSNAIRYTPQWGKIVVRAALNQDRLVISVENSGYGVPLERLQRMFERNDNPDAPEFGQGLALILAREIVEAHGGKIGAGSELGVMTRFHIDLPINQTYGEKP